MVNYRRHYTPGGTYFFTLALHDRRSELLVRRINDLRTAFRSVLERKPVYIDAIVILPDHLHAIWTLPKDDVDFSGRWRAIKSRFVRCLRTRGIRVPLNHRGEAQVWQRRFWEHTIRDDEDYRNHVDYVHYNAVKHGLVRSPVEWPYSSFHRFVARGVLPADWASEPDDSTINARGEPR